MHEKDWRGETTAKLMAGNALQWNRAGAVPRSILTLHLARITPSWAEVRFGEMSHETPTILVVASRVSLLRPRSLSMKAIDAFGVWTVQRTNGNRANSVPWAAQVPYRFRSDLLTLDGTPRGRGGDFELNCLALENPHGQRVPNCSSSVRHSPRLQGESFPGPPVPPQLRTDTSAVRCCGATVEGNVRCYYVLHKFGRDTFQSGLLTEPSNRIIFSSPGGPSQRPQAHHQCRQPLVLGDGGMNAFPQAPPVSFLQRLAQEDWLCSGILFTTVEPT